ncbi:MAG: 2-amino-4-hydroxy-6-hydroxymethyldihydropteridine diphosphokinase [Bacteroidales bacterium]|nr:2-amino-4-hydroxy-6-hydroxymethyldihydropteridine diphosphokinase [Bacteroidales bacterium]
MNKVYLLFGSNIEPRLSFLQKAEHKVAGLVGNILNSSLVYESEPWGFRAAQRFLNQVLLVETGLSAREVLKRVLSIENEMGRQRTTQGYSSRQIDIDILYFKRECIHEPGLIVPHPGIADRRFVLLPLVELEAGFVHPVLMQSNDDLLKRCGDELRVCPFDEQKGREI